MTPTGTLGLAMVSQEQGWTARGQGIMALGSPPLGRRGQTLGLQRALPALQPRCHCAWCVPTMSGLGQGHGC